MSLVLPQSVLVKWNFTSKNHYINLGYNFTEIGNEFLCDVKDISHGSCVLIKVKCDFCDSVSTIPYRQYCKLKSDKYCCPNCLSHKKKARDNEGNLTFIEIPYRNRNWLYEEYIVKNRMSYDIAKECGINVRTLREWIAMLDLNIKKEKRHSIDKEILHSLYEVEHKTTEEIGEMFGLSGNTVLRLLNEYQIPIPDRSELMRRYFYEKGGVEKFREYANNIDYRINTSCRQHNISPDEFEGFSATESHMIRNSSQYIEWRTKVFERDNFICQKCGRRGGDLEAHHLYPFAEYPRKRFLIDNGVTLCSECHSPKYKNSFHALYGVHNNTPEQYYDFLKNSKVSA